MEPAKLRSLRLTVGFARLFFAAAVVEVAIDGVKVCLGAGLDDVGARALASDEIAITEINFNTHFAQRVLALRHSADSVILQTPGHLGKTIDRL